MENLRTEGGPRSAKGSGGQNEGQRDRETQRMREKCGRPGQQGDAKAEGVAEVCCRQAKRGQEDWEACRRAALDLT